ncbi:MAG: UvrB/UvrC motif-containing protein [bacterium]
MKNNQKYTLHICHVCAHEKGVAGPAVNTSFSIEQILSGYQTAPEASAVETQVQSRTCPVCQLSYNAFKESGRLGCPVCYDTFSEQLKPLLRKIQKEINHIGKIPHLGDQKLVLRRSITDLRSQLKEAVTNEHFELAARLRDQIRDMESELEHIESQK